MFTAAHDDIGKFGPRERCQDPGYLSWRQPSACQPAQQSWLPAGTCQELQEQTEPAEAAQLVCPNRKGKGPTFFCLWICRLFLSFIHGLVYSTDKPGTQSIVVLSQ